MNWRQSRKAVVTVLALAGLSLAAQSRGGEERIAVGKPFVAYEIPYVDDHSVIFSPSDRKWHMFGIVSGHKSFIQLTADSLTQIPWERHEDFIVGNGDKEIWAPHIILHDGLFYMFYTMIGEPREIRHAVSKDLHEWSHPDSNPLLALKTEDGVNMKNKDPMVLSDGGRWIMYYSMMKDEKHWVVGYSTSADLVNWSGPETCFDENTESPGVESPFVVRRAGDYYLFLSSRPWPAGGVDIFVSHSPVSWKVADLAKRIDPWHAPEVVRDLDGQWYLTLSSGPQAKDFRIAPMFWNDGHDGDVSSMASPK